MCSSDIFLGLLAILFPPSQVRSRPLSPSPSIHPPTLHPLPITIRRHTQFSYLSSDTNKRHSANFPRLTVWVKTGLCSADSLINILLCTLGFIPGLLHAWYIIAKYPDPDDSYAALPQDAESGRVTYIIVQGPNGHQQRVAKNLQQGYGTVPQPNVHQGQNGSWGVGGQVGGVVNNAAASGEGSSSRREEQEVAVPPTYAEAVKGDHKVQNHD